MVLARCYKQTHLHSTCTPSAQFANAIFPHSPLFMPNNASGQRPLPGPAGPVGLGTWRLAAGFAQTRNPTNTARVLIPLWLLSVELRAHPSVAAKGLDCCGKWHAQRPSMVSPGGLLRGIPAHTPWTKSLLRQDRASPSFLPTNLKTSGIWRRDLADKNDARIG